MTKLALVFFLIFSFCGSCFAYDLYVNSEADTEYVDPEGQILYPDGTNDRPYLHIQDAINHAFNDLHPDNQVIPPPSVQILVAPNEGGYQEHLIMNYHRDGDFQDHIVHSISITTDPAYPGQCNIIGRNDLIDTITVYGSNNGTLAFKNVKLSLNNAIESSYAIKFNTNTGSNYSSLYKLEIDDCLFENYFFITGYCDSIDSLIVQSSTFDNPVYDQLYSFGPKGIEIRGARFSYSKAIIQNNTFANNSQYNYCLALILYGFANTEISGNIFINASVSYVSTTYVSLDQSVFIDNNIFTNSQIKCKGEFYSTISNNRFYGTATYEGAISIINDHYNQLQEGDHKIRDNIFWEVPTPILMSRENSINLNQIISTSVTNNSFIYCGIVAKMYHHLHNNVATNRINSFINNLYLGDSDFPIIVLDINGQPTSLTGDDSIPVSYSHFRYDLSDTCLNSLDTLNVSYGLPDIIEDTENYTYSLRWDNDVRSPLIMAGYEGELTTSRYDRIDIGAVQYDDQEHEYITYTFPPYSQRNGLKWMSFPTLDRIWNPETNDPDVAFNLFTEIMDIDTLDYIGWKVLDNPIQKIQYLLGNWMGENHIVIPQQGYKIQMRETAINTQFIRLPGIIPDVTQYPLTIKAFPADKNDPWHQYNENWLGYFNNSTSYAEDAFAGIIDNLWYIQTQNWTMVREEVSPGSPWICAMQYGKAPTLSYGDMVIVKCFHDAQFTWNTTADNQIPIEKELPSHYVYEEKADYVPFYVELDADDLPSEVALYVDDVCKGAAVVCDSLVEIPGYILDGTDPDAQVEILAYYDNKAAVNKIPAYQVWNPESGSYDNKPLKLSSKNHYYKLKLEKNGDGAPAISEPALSIYPNPFNPSTTIKFCLTDPADIKLEIYNQKGQLVKCLTQGKADSGFSSINWNGTDSHNRKVASGLYYSRLSFNGKSITKKMILMK